MRPFGFKAENKNIVKQSTLENLTKDGDLMKYDDVAEWAEISWKNVERIHNYRIARLQSHVTAFMLRKIEKKLKV
ncbi:hypothetical protein KIN20_020041 [Parelaphostrongylus tenuis]|uniref:Uncharacterized protein n=1 Tax=Parelaphostrongylus tenuis TaxID=148309 RepID=A0AAD5MLW7_PARTN|nr:hypothetical protein KIN20_020041 [Parelaphostrongylus tenuis]